MELETVSVSTALKQTEGIIVQTIPRYLVEPGKADNVLGVGTLQKTR